VRIVAEGLVVVTRPEAQQHNETAPRVHIEGFKAACVDSGRVGLSLEHHSRQW
jgi:hypothetical protein